jgi:hypothetical protein
MRHVVLLSGLALTLVVCPPAGAADVPVSGTSLTVVDNPVKPNSRKAVFKSRDEAISLGLEDPGVAGATVELVNWSGTTIRDGLNGAFTHDGLRLGGFRKYGTHFTTDSGDFAP